jgi:uncharacterized protein YbcI
MDETQLTMAQKVARVAGVFHHQKTGHAPKAVTVVLSGDTLVSTLHDALTPAEHALARSPEGAAQVQEFHRRLFANSADSFRQEIRKITGMEVREAAAEVDTTTGTVVHAFTNGTRVQVVLLARPTPEDACKGHRPRAASDDEEMNGALDALELAASNLALALAIGGGVKEIPGGRERDCSNRA